MNQTSNTPRTDALWTEWNSDSGTVECRDMYELARTLERENQELRAALKSTIYRLDEVDLWIRTESGKPPLWNEHITARVALAGGAS